MFTNGDRSVPPAMFDFLVYTCVVWSPVIQATFNGFTLHKVFKLRHSPCPSAQDPSQRTQTDA